MAQVKEKALTKADLQNSKANVDSKTAKDRLWESLDYGYGKEREASNKAYDKTASESARSMIGKGMQRSSYGAQTQANIANEKIKASNDIYDKQVADYTQGLYQIERDEKSDEFRQQELNNQAAQVGAQYAQIAANKEIAANELAFKKEQQKWQNEFNERDWWLKQQTQTAATDLDTRRVAVEEGTLALNTANSVASNDIAQGRLDLDTQIAANNKEASDTSLNLQAQQIANAKEESDATLALRKEEIDNNKAASDTSLNLQAQQIANNKEASDASLNLQAQEIANNKEASDASLNLQAQQIANNKEASDKSLALQEREFESGTGNATQTQSYNIAVNNLAEGKPVSKETLEKAGISVDEFIGNGGIVAGVNEGSASTSSNSTPYWKQLGFNSEWDYKEAKGKGLTKNSKKYYADKNGNGTTYGSVIDTW